MRNTWKALGLLAVLAMLSGCSIKHTPPTIEEVSVYKIEQSARAACYQARAIASQADAVSMKGVPEKDKLFMILMKQQGDTAKEMLALATNRSLDPCDAGTNLFDVQIAEVRAAVEMNEDMLGAAKWGVGLGLGAWVSIEAIDALSAGGDVITSLSGGSNYNVDSQNSGSKNIAGGDTINTDSGVEIKDSSQNTYEGDNQRGSRNSEEEVEGEEVCPEGEEWDPIHKNCTGTCRENQYWDTELKECVEGVNPAPLADEGDGGNEALADCRANPPGGTTTWGVPMYDEHTSCNSYYGR